jgi:hypothetical protein
MFLKYKDLAKEIQNMWDVKTNVTSNESGKWNHLKIMQKTSEQHNRKALHQGTTENSQAVYCKQASGSANVKVQNVHMHDIFQPQNSC